MTRSHSFCSSVELKGSAAIVSAVMGNYKFNIVISLVIAANMCLIVYETNANTPCAESGDVSKCESSTVIALNLVFLFIYTLEAGCRLYVHRCRTFLSMTNNLEIAIVILGYVDLWLASMADGLPGPSLALLRLVRVFRLLRMVRIFQKIPELHAMVRGFFSAMASMFWGFFLIAAFLLFFSVLTVELVYPLALHIYEAEEDHQCRASFSSVWQCFLWFFQILVAGDEFARCVMPLVNDQWWTFILFALALICVELGFMNLVLAVIVDRAAKAKEEDLEECKRERDKQSHKATQLLSRLCSDIDEDGSGTISLTELLQGFDHNDEMKYLFSKLDMTRNDVEELFQLMDVDEHGELSYKYFIDHLRTSQMDDSRKHLVMLRLQVAEIARHCVKLTGQICNKTPAMSRQTSAKQPTRIISKFDGLSTNHDCLVDPQLLAEKLKLDLPDRQDCLADQTKGTTSFGIELERLRASLDADFERMTNSIVQLMHSAVFEPQDLIHQTSSLRKCSAIAEDKAMCIEPAFHEAESILDMSPSSPKVHLLKEQRNEDHYFAGHVLDLRSANLEAAAIQSEVTTSLARL